MMQNDCHEWLWCKIWRGSSIWDMCTLVPHFCLRKWNLTDVNIPQMMYECDKPPQDLPQRQTEPACILWKYYICRSVACDLRYVCMGETWLHRMHCIRLWMKYIACNKSSGEKILHVVLKYEKEWRYRYHILKYWYLLNWWNEWQSESRFIVF